MAKGFKHGAGGGASLNFKVVGGTAAPASPKENTVWVNTSTAITGWAFCMEEPETPRKLAVTPKRKNTSERFEETPLNKNAKLIIILSLAAILLLFVIQGIYSKELANENQPEQQMEQQVEENQEPEKTPEDPEEPAVPQEPEAPVYDGLEMRLEIINANPNAVDQCWMQITVDGKLTETTMSEGQVQDIKATQNIQLNLGNSGVVKVTLNGQDLGVLGNQGQVVKKSFNLEDYVTQTQ